MTVVVFAAGVLMGVVAGWGAGRYWERAAHAWGIAIPRLRHARRLTREAAGVVALASAVVAVAVAILATRR
jgi:hypothetical protein